MHVLELFFYIDADWAWENEITVKKSVKSTMIYIVLLITLIPVTFFLRKKLCRSKANYMELFWKTHEERHV